MSTTFRHLGKYELHECLSRSKVSEVWKSYDTRFQRAVAIKMIIASTRDVPNFALHFTHEVEAVIALRHPNIARIYEAQLLPTQNPDTVLVYLVMDYIEGRSLAEYIPDIPRSGKFLPGNDIVHCFASLGKAIDYAHQHGVIHGNIKPTNIILDRSFSSTNRRFEPILTSFNLTNMLGNHTNVPANQSLTSMLYISPEQAKGHSPSEQSDIYTLGVILYEICTGVPPFQGTRPVALLTQHASTAPRSPSLINPNISSALANVIMRCLEKDPTERFATASSMAVALAKALNIPIPKSLGILSGEDTPGEATDHIRAANSQFQSSPDLGYRFKKDSSLSGFVDTPGESTDHIRTTNSQFQSSPDLGYRFKKDGSLSGFVDTPGESTDRIRAANSQFQSSPDLGYRFKKDSSLSGFVDTPETIKAPLSGPEVAVVPVLPSRTSLRRRNQRGLFVVLAILLLLAIVVPTVGTFYLLHRQTSSSAPASVSIVGHAFFTSSGQLNANASTQGVNDELQVDLSGIPAPGTGQSYYGWLLPDKSQTEAAPIFLGRLLVDHSQIHFLYTGGQNHINLLEVTSRFLITEEDSALAPTLPSLDTNKWRYYAELTQNAGSADKLHFSMLNHFRHLLVESPELKARGLHGGLAASLLQSEQQVLTLANSARYAWQTKDYATVHNQIIRIIDFLDGRTLARTELPPTLTLLTDPQQYDQIPLLGEDLKHLQPAGSTYTDGIPPGYVYLIGIHLSAALQAPATTPDQHKLATQVNAALNNVDHWLDQAHDDTMALIRMNDDQLAQPSTLTVLNDLVTLSQYAYAGHINQATGQLQGGVIWIYANIQRLADFSVARYVHS